MNQAFSFLSHDEEKTLSDYCENHFVSYNDRPCEDLSFLDFWKAFISSLEEKGAEKQGYRNRRPEAQSAFGSSALIKSE